MLWYCCYYFVSKEEPEEKVQLLLRPHSPVSISHSDQWEPLVRLLHQMASSLSRPNDRLILQYMARHIQESAPGDSIPLYLQQCYDDHPHLQSHLAPIIATYPIPCEDFALNS